MSAARGWRSWVPTGIVVFFALLVLASARVSRSENAFDVSGFGQLPVLNGGRLKPLDTLARTALLEISGKQTLHDNGHQLSALRWLLDVMFKPDVASRYRVFQIDNPDVLGLLGIQQKTQRLFSFADLSPNLDVLEEQAAAAAKVKASAQSRYQSAVENLRGRITLYEKLENTLQLAGTENVVNALRQFHDDVAPALKAHVESPDKSSQLLAPLFKEFEAYRFLNDAAEFYPIPMEGAAQDPNRWTSVGQAVLKGAADKYPAAVLSYAAMADAWRAGDPLIFNQSLQGYQADLSKNVPRVLTRSRAECMFNRVQPFYQSLEMYVVAFILVFLSWIVWPHTLNRSAFWLIVFAFTVHTAGLVARMALQGRPPVTNLYSSAIFVGWIAVLLGIILERLYRNGMGSMVASTIGFLTLIIAHHLASSGDTLEMMRAVLDSNFWLATHVVSITVGYGSTFLAGFLGILYLIRRMIDPNWNEGTAASLERMAYGIVCFAMFFSFLGTILGGIWADQSWGRFWGWDPKENGALMIVLWNAFILHARLGSYAKGQTFMIMTVFGNIVTALSWFGVNMLGIGLHSYGFMDKTFSWLIIFVLIQLAVMQLGFWPDPHRASKTKK